MFRRRRKTQTPPDEAATTVAAGVLVVDDEHGITSAILRHLRREGLRVCTAESAEAALTTLESRPFDVVITDINMPGRNGLELLAEVKAREPSTQVIVMTAYAQIELVVDALRLHADDYLLKPFDLHQLTHSVNRCLEHRRLLLENQAYRAQLEDRVRSQARRLEGLFLAGIRSLIAALEAKDPHTRGHSDRVTQYSLRIAETLGDGEARSLAIGAALHDIGKIGTRDDVLTKPGPLTDDEATHIRTHPLVGERILAPILDTPDALGVVRHHHERWDGRGYPDGVVGAAIPVHARIVAVADSLDAITSARAYRPARDWGEALSEITRCAGSQFDPDVVDAALVALRDRPALPGAAS